MYDWVLWLSSFHLMNMLRIESERVDPYSAYRMRHRFHVYQCSYAWMPVCVCVCVRMWMCVVRIKYFPIHAKITVWMWWQMHTFRSWYPTHTHTCMDLHKSTQSTAAVYTLQKIQTSLQIGKSRKLTLLFQSYADLDPLLIPTSPIHSISVTHFYRKHTWCIYSMPEFMRFLLLLPFRGWFFNEILFILLWRIFLSNSWSRQIEIDLHETDVSPNQTNILSHHNVNLITTKYILLCFVFHTFNYFTFHPEIINGNCFISSDIIFLLFYSFRITKRLITHILNFPLNW